MPQSTSIVGEWSPATMNILTSASKAWVLMLSIMYTSQTSLLFLNTVSSVMQRAVLSLACQSRFT
eukprot:1572398-Rhodomonas_salina.3